MATKDLKLRVSVDGAEQAQSKLGMLGNTMKSMLGTAALVAAGMMALRTTVQVFSQSVKEAENAEISLRKLNNVLTSTGQNANWTTEELVKMAGNLQKFSNFGDDDIMQQATASLLRFTNIGKEEFPRVLQLVVDMGAETGNLEGAAKQLGLSMDDPILGMTRLRRAGVSLTEEMQNQIKQYVAAGKIQEAQKVLLSELEIKYKGNAAALMSSTQVMKNAWGDYLETLGASSKTALDGIKLAFSNFFVKLAKDQQSLTDATKAQTREMFISWNRAATAMQLNVNMILNAVWGYLKGIYQFAKDVTAVIRNMNKVMSFDIFKRGTIDQFSKSVTTTFQNIEANMNTAWGGLVNYERDFNRITDQSLSQWDAMQGEVTGFAQSLEELGDAGAGAGLNAVTEKANAARQALDNLTRSLQVYSQAEISNQFLADYLRTQSDFMSIFNEMVKTRQLDQISQEQFNAMSLQARQGFVDNLVRIEQMGIRGIEELHNQYNQNRIASLEHTQNTELASVLKYYDDYVAFLDKYIELLNGNVAEIERVNALKTQILELQNNTEMHLLAKHGSEMFSAYADNYQQELDLLKETNVSYDEYYRMRALIITYQIDALRALGYEEELLAKVQAARMAGIAAEYEQMQPKIEEVTKSYSDLSNLIESNLSNAFYSLISNTQNFADSFKNIWKDLTSSVLRYITQMLAKMAAMALFQSILGGGSGLIGLTTGSDPLNINGIVGSALGTLSTGNSPRYTPDVSTNQNDGQFNRLITRLENTINSRQPQDVVLRIGNREFRNAIQYSTIEANVM